jgi:hypothetical protein
MMQMQRQLSEPELERAYDLIAEAIDRVGRAQESQFLARLSLALSAQLPAIGLLIEAIRAAERDLPARD